MGFREVGPELGTRQPRFRTHAAFLERASLPPAPGLVIGNLEPSAVIMSTYYSQPSIKETYFPSLTAPKTGAPEADKADADSSDPEAMRTISMRTIPYGHG